MAAISFFILLTLTLSSTIHARESQFFNKESHEPLNTNQQQQQPDFIQQSQDSDPYGLYGHQSGQLQLSPSTTNTTTTTIATTTTNNNNNNNIPLVANLPENYNPVAYTTPIHSTNQHIIPDEYNNNKVDPQAYLLYNNGDQKRMYNSQEQDEFMGTNGGDMYNSQKQGFDDARFMETEDAGIGGNMMYNSHKKQVRYNQDEEMYNSQMQGMGDTKYSTSNNANMYNNEKQGMSDTRFIENGKYFYDVNMENLNTRGFDSRNEYINTQGQGYYGNSYDRYNSNSNFDGGGYQNQEDQFNP